MFSLDHLFASGMVNSFVLPVILVILGDYFKHGLTNTKNVRNILCLLKELLVYSVQLNREGREPQAWSQLGACSSASQIPRYSTWLQRLFKY